MSKILIDKLDNNLNDRAQKNERPFRNIHPSSFGGCLRKVAYRYYAFDKKPKPIETLRNFQNGNAFHERIQAECEEAEGINVLGIETPVKNEEYKLFGYIDGIIEIDGVCYVLEIKSKKDRSFTKYLDVPDKDHIVQVNIYMWLIKETLEEAQSKTEHSDIEKGILALKEAPDQAILIYENKNDHKQKEFVVDRDEAVIQWVKFRANKFWEIVGKNKLPPQEHVWKKGAKRKPLECEYMCDYAHICWAGRS